MIENSIYNLKRKKVEVYTKEHYDVLKREFKQGGGKHLDMILTLAKVKSSKRQKVKKQLQDSYQVIFHNTQGITERIMMTFGRLYLAKEKTKKMNGFSYTEASNIVKNHLNSNFEALRQDIKNGKTTELEKIASKLNIKDSKKKQFIHSFDGKYFEIYVDVVVVSVMIYGE